MLWLVISMLAYLFIINTIAWYIKFEAILLGKKVFYQDKIVPYSSSISLYEVFRLLTQSGFFYLNMLMVAGWYFLRTDPLFYVAIANCAIYYALGVPALYVASLWRRHYLVVLSQNNLGEAPNYLWPAERKLVTNTFAAKLTLSVFAWLNPYENYETPLLAQRVKS